MSNIHMEKITIQKYQPEQAGQYAAWMDVNQIPDTPVIRGAITYARIGPTGAEHFTSRLSSGEYAMPRSEGFNNPVSIEFTQHPEQTATSYNEVRAVLAPGAPWSRLSYSDKQVELHPVIMPEIGTWVLGDKEILKTLKEKLAERDLEWFYATLYHTLAYVAREEDLLADPEMHSETTTQVSIVGEHIRALEDIETRDTIMRNNLTVFGDLSQDQVPAAFRESRQRVRESEKSIETLAKTITLGRNLGTIGFRSGGRSWPYMDASTDDEDRAFGRELAYLEQKNAFAAMYELKRELDELESRRVVSEAIKDRLGLLAVKESQSA